VRSKEKVLFLDPILSKRVRRVIGLSSGTSMDGMDAALVDIRGCGSETSVRLLAFTTLPFRPDIRERLARVAGIDGGPSREICLLNVEVAEAAAAAAEEVARKAAVPMEEVDLIGSHGQTICHLPGDDPRASLQIGEGAVVAERTGVTTVSNFRARDLAAGGQGAPLIPYVDWLLFRSEEEGRALLNLGGIANVTLLPRGLGLETVTAFDTGPGNMVIDGLSRILSADEAPFDRNGDRAGEGRLVEGLLTRLLEHPYFRERPPKSTGREVFGETFVEQVMEMGRALGASNEDLLATATELTARTVAQAIAVWVADPASVGRMIVSGGGIHNRTLMKRLSTLMKPIPVVRLEEMGFPSDAKEAIAFAVLANETAHGLPSNVPGATGARRAVVLGELVPGRSL